MSAKRKPAESPRTAKRKAPYVPTVHTCVECPVCGTETCKTLQDLGMYCNTEIAASEASHASRPVRSGKRSFAVA
jgi:hypothetical protein